MYNNQFFVYIEQDEEGQFIGSIPSIPSCYAEGETQEEMIENLKEVITLTQRNQEEEISSRFIGIQTFIYPNAKTRPHISQKISQNSQKTRV